MFNLLILLYLIHQHLQPLTTNGKPGFGFNKRFTHLPFRQRSHTNKTCNITTTHQPEDFAIKFVVHHGRCSQFRRHHCTSNHQYNQHCNQCNQCNQLCHHDNHQPLKRQGPPSFEHRNRGTRQFFTNVNERIERRFAGLNKRFLHNIHTWFPK